MLEELTFTGNIGPNMILPPERQGMTSYKTVTCNNYMPTCSILWDVAIQNMHNRELDISMSLKVKVIGEIRKPTYSVLLVNYSKYACLQPLKICMTLSLTFMVKVDGVIRKPTYDFPLVNDSKHMPICSILQI